MYGMVNQAIESMVTEKFGASQWELIKARAGIEDPAFVMMKQYPDAVTYALATAVAEHMKMPIADVLHAFGIYWIEFARKGPWGKLMQASGSNTFELLAALDAMHTRIAVSFPDLEPPSFRVEPRGSGLLLEYRSHRPGLAPFVLGLVQGVGNMYGEHVEIQQVASKDAGAPCDAFMVHTRLALTSE